MKGSEYIIQFDKCGIIAAQNEYSFGRIYWEVKIHQQAAHQTTDDSGSVLRIGVINKVNKAYNVVGAIINYAVHKNNMKVQLCLDMDSRILYILSSNTTHPEIIANLPEGPLYPAFQNKTNKNSNFALKFSVTFDTPPFDTEKSKGVN
jgi:hypothetical protein